MGHPKPPCHLLMLQGVTLAHKGLAPSGLSSKFIISKNLIIFTIQGTHSSYPQAGFRHFVGKKVYFEMQLFAGNLGLKSRPACSCGTLWAILFPRIKILYKSKRQV